MLSQTLVVLIGLTCCFGNPLERPEAENVTLVAEVLEDGRIMIDDMRMTFEQFNELYPHVETLSDKKATVHKRGVAVGKSGVWPGGRIPYAWAANLPGSRQAVLQAMNTWMGATCVRFVPRTGSDYNYLLIQDNHRVTCNADLGYQRRQVGMFLNKNCFGQPVLLHELGHVLGLIHEQQHPNRDRYLTIYWQNIDPANQQWFKTEGDTWGFDYDIYSIMHYRDNAFARSGCAGCKTMHSKYPGNYDQYMGTRTTLSARSDIPIVKKMYNCR